MDNGRQRSRKVDVVALIALMLSVFSVSWQAYDRYIGAEVEQLDYSGYLVEFRCNSGSNRKCWSGDGHLVVILPVFFSNTGTIDYNEAVERVTLRLSVNDSTDSVRMLATAFWHNTQNATVPSTPFHPIVIGGRSAAGHELRFVGEDPKTRLDWSTFVDDVIEKKVGKITLITETVFSIETEPIEKSCTVTFSDKHREVLVDRRADFDRWASCEGCRSPKKHISTYCDNGSKS